jgi:alpha-tubulin suppressor-like RCC1 family protein
MTHAPVRATRVIIAALALAATVVVGLASPAVSATGWTSVSSGDGHTCGIRNGRIYCWGLDDFGQLGDGTAGGNRAVPAPIASGATDWTSVSAGQSHTCATRAGRIACWGYDGLGQLGDGTATNGPDPTPGLISSGATDWKKVSAGGNHTCAIRAGRIACWGADGFGQLGDGSAGPNPDPMPGLIMSGATDWTSVSGGASHTCATRAGRIACWGNDGSGQLGDGSAGGVDPTPGLIASGATDWTSVSTGHLHTCATRSGRVACWGFDGFGQLGDGSAANGPDPTPGLIASGATDWTSVSAGGYHTCATRSGRVACWGYDEYGTLGDGSAGVNPDPTPNLIASGATDWKKVESGTFHTCAIRATVLACWGYDGTGQLGDGTPGVTPDPTPGLVS